MSNGEFVQYPEDVGDGALTGFHDDGERAREFVEAGATGPGTGQVNVPAQTQGGNDPLPQGQPTWEEQQADFQRQMEGEQHASGVQHDLQTRGFTSDDYVNQAVEYQQQEWNDLDEQAQVAEHNWSAQQNQPNFQQLYGQSENEKGELRRANQALEERLARMEQFMAQANQPKFEAPTFFGPPQAQAQAPQVQNTAAPTAPQVPQYHLPADIKFVQKADDEMVLAGDVNQAIREQVAPYVLDALNRAQSAEQNLNQMRAQVFEQQKLFIGITPQVEQQALTQMPWLRNVTDPQAYLGALTDYKNNLDRQAQAQAVQPRPLPQARQQQNPQAQRIVRRTTYVEGAGRSGGAEAPQQQGGAQAQWEAAWAQTLTLPFGERAAKQRELLQARGVGSVTGFRNPNVLTR